MKIMSMENSLVAVVMIVSFLCVSKASVISKSSKEECIVENDVKNVNNTICSTKLVVSLTVNANEVHSLILAYSFRLILYVFILPNRENRNL